MGVVLENFVRRILEKGNFKENNSTPPHPTPPHPTPAFPFNGMAFSINVRAFPINGMAPGLAAAPGHRQVALGTKKVVRTWTGAGPGPGGAGPRATFFAPSARPWERPVTGNAQ